MTVHDLQRLLDLAEYVWGEGFEDAAVAIDAAKRRLELRLPSSPTWITLRAVEGGYSVAICRAEYDRESQALVTIERRTSALPTVHAACEAAERLLS